MKTNKQKTNWVIDAVLTIAFWLAFFLDLTGLALHQWLGIAVGALATYHLLVHWDWVKAVTRRLWEPTSGRGASERRASERGTLFYLIDTALILGLGLIITSGLVISTWLSLPLGNYAAWKDVHVLASVISLLVLVLKLALHGRWIAGVARRYIFTPPAGRSIPAVQPAAASGDLDRRDFLKWMGVIGAGGVLAVGSALQDSVAILADSGSILANNDAILTNSDASLSSSGTSPANNDAILTNSDASLSSSSTSPANSDASSANSDASPANSDTNPANESSSDRSEANSPGTESTTSQAPTTCTVRCNRMCSYPGRCRRYVDSNNNNRCDWGECMENL
ncbi:MAG: twin-arginine translocation signal domain-containing protein [Thermoflexales bacterium]|nr:twin-arginine translocation signal domain-containing protein [Thermoflexales bacterium]